MRRTLLFGTLVAAVVGSAMTLGATSAAADPSANDWASLRQCESSGNYHISTGNGYYGAYQFDLSTWQSVGGSGSPANASPAEQDYRALYLYRMRGWSPWVCASLAGLAEDSGAGSGRAPNRADAAYIGGGGSGSFTPVEPSTCRLGSSTPPEWGGTVFTRGNTYRGLECWQKQMGQRGYGLSGTGFFGGVTLAAVHSAQAAVGLKRSDVIDAATWAAAWGVRPAPRPTPRPAPRPAPRPTPPPVPAPRAGHVWPGLTPSICRVGARTAPAWPGRSFELGSDDKALACWQMQMGHRGYGLTGVGHYGEMTLAAAVDIQLRNGLHGTGLIGPKTWKAAWEGSAKR